jgi:hypothetical protein
MLNQSSSPNLIKDDMQDDTGASVSPTKRRSQKGN